MDFDVKPDSSESLIAFKHISILADDEEWKANRPFDLLLIDGEAHLDSIILSSRRGSVGAMASYSSKSGNCQLSGWGSGVDLSLFRDADVFMG